MGSDPDKTFLTPRKNGSGGRPGPDPLGVTYVIEER